MDRRSIRRISNFVFAAASSASLVAIAYAAFASEPARWGPIKCDYCINFRLPYPDAEAQAVLEKFVNDPYPNQITILPRGVEIGDVITVCNDKICVDFRLNQSRKFEGIKSRPVQTVGGGGGQGSGGRGGGGYSGPISGGSYGGGGGRTGTVTVGGTSNPGGGGGGVGGGRKPRIVTEKAE